MSKKKKKKIQTKAKRGREKTCDGELKNSNILPNHINPKYYYIKNTMILQPKVKLQKRINNIYIYIEREREREREIETVITFSGAK